jgi:hypothetical protein
MNAHDIETIFQQQIAGQVTLVADGPQRYVIHSPFIFDDGDCLGIILKKEHGQWVLSDEGTTYMHLSLTLDELSLGQGPRQAIIASALSMFGITDRDGELIIPVEHDNAGVALYDFIQGLLKISDLTYLTRERVVSTFLDDFREFMISQIPSQRRVFDWFDYEHDPDGKYTVDCGVNGIERPLFVYALSNEAHVREAMINLLTFAKWGLVFRTMAIFADVEGINQRVVRKFADVCDRIFPTLTADKDRIAQYLQQILRESQGTTS